MASIRRTEITVPIVGTLGSEHDVRGESTQHTQPQARTESMVQTENEARIDSPAHARIEAPLESLPQTPSPAQSASTLELFGMHSCPYTAELREELDWQGREYVEYDVEGDGEARARLEALAPGCASVPVLVEDGTVLQVGYRGRSCYVLPV